MKMVSGYCLSWHHLTLNIETKEPIKPMNSNNHKASSDAGADIANSISLTYRKREVINTTPIPNALGQFDSYWKDYRHSDYDTWK